MNSTHRSSRRFFLKQTALGLFVAAGLPRLAFATTLQSDAKLATCGNFDREFARLLLEICRYTYSATIPDDSKEKQDMIESLAWINNTGNPKITHLDDGKGKHSTSVVCVVCYSDKNIVSYMGTKTEFNNAKNGKQSIEDWAKNAEFIPVPFQMTKNQLGIAGTNDVIDLGGKDGLVHEGFLKELKVIHEKVIEVLNSNGGKSRDLYITGHSQGGAEAALATLAFSAAGFNVKATYTFAAPRSSNQAIANAIPKNIPIHRIEFGNDIVPHVPTTHLGHQSVQKVIADFAKLGLSAKHLEVLDAKHHLVGIGLLCYGNNTNKSFRVDMSANEELKIFDQRLKDLLKHPKDLAENHHLAGTSAEVDVGKKGNYRALISEFSCQVG